MIFQENIFSLTHPPFFQIEKTHHNSLSLVLVDDNVETPEETEEREEEERKLEELREARAREERCILQFSLRNLSYFS